jgi:hypothetical protein
VREGEEADAAIRRIANEQAGILEPKATHLGHFTYTAGSLNKRYAAGTRVYDALYAVEVGDLADSPGDESFERRIILQRDLNEILRSTYVERRREYTDALDWWLVERIKANIKAGSGA